MSTERGPYLRTQYDESKHCGFAIDRNPESLRARIEKYAVVIGELEALQQQRELTKYELIKLRRKQRIKNVVERKLTQLEEQGPDDRPCVKTKGQGTDHPGVGYCRFHCSCKGRQDGHLSYYSRKAKDKKLQTLIDEMDASNEDALNLMPEIYLLRAKVKLFVEEKQDFDPETVRSLTLLSEQLRKTVETVNDKKFKTMISHDVFNALLFRMGEVLTKYVADQEILDKIASDWQRISVDAAEKRGSRALSAENG